MTAHIRKKIDEFTLCSLFQNRLFLVCGLLRLPWFPPPVKHDGHGITEILLKVALNTKTIYLTLFPDYFLAKLYTYFSGMTIGSSSTTSFRSAGILSTAFNTNATINSFMVKGEIISMQNKLE
jgi:hypothetical protein